MNYYNDNDPKSAERLRQLVSAGLIPDGYVDQRSVLDITPDDLAPYTQCHFFAGIGGWPLALAMAGISPDTRLWTGSCPCQPFSAAGQRRGTDDERHLWPVFRDLIAQCKPPIVFGEQVASADGRTWLSTVRSEMEGLGYAVGAADLCAAGVGAPHPRQRLWFVGLADAECLKRRSGSVQQFRETDGPQSCGATAEFAGDCDGGRMAHADSERRDGIDLLLREDPARRDEGEAPKATGSGSVGRLANADNEGPQGRDRKHAGAQERENEARHSGPLCAADQTPYPGRPSQTDSFWAAADWLWCRDGRWRPAEPGTFPLAHGVSGRVALIKGYGNAIVPQVAATFIRAALNV